MLAEATATGIERIAISIQSPGGQDAVSLRIAEQYVQQFGHLAKANNTMILPSNLSDIGGTVAALSQVLQANKAPKPTS